MTDTSKVNSAWFRKQSAADSSRCSSSIHRMKLLRHPRVMTTPFGSPVLPDVNMT